MTSVALHEIVFDDDIYPRAAWSQNTVDRYADAMLAGEMFPPVILESGTNRLLDGRHRTEAYRAVDRDLVPVDYHEIPDGVPAKLYAASLSSRHGDPLASEDKRQVARETATSNPDFSMVLIAKLLGTTRQTVSKYVGDLVERRRDVRKVKAKLLKHSGMSMQQIADELAVGKATAVEDVNADISDRLTEALLREAAADLPIDAEPIIASFLAESTPAEPGPEPEAVSTQIPGPAGAERRPPADPGVTPAPAVGLPSAPAPQEPDLTAEILRVLGEVSDRRRTAAEIAREFPDDTWANGVLHADLISTLEQLLAVGKVVVDGRTPNGARCWALTPEPVAAPATAPAGSGAEAVASPRESGGATAEDLRDRVLIALPIGEDDAVTFGQLMSKLGDPEGDGRRVLRMLYALEESGQAACTQGPVALVWWAAGLGSDYKTDPAERIAAVAEVAPEFVKPVEPHAIAAVESGRRSAETVVATVRAEVLAIIAAVDLGEQLITEQLVADLRAAVDLLASRLEVPA